MERACSYQYGDFDLALGIVTDPETGWADEGGHCKLPARVKWMGEWYCTAHADILMDEDGFEED